MGFFDETFQWNLPLRRVMVLMKSGMGPSLADEAVDFDTIGSTGKCGLKF